MSTLTHHHARGPHNVYSGRGMFAGHGTVDIRNTNGDGFTVTRRGDRWAAWSHADRRIRPNDRPVAFASADRDDVTAWVERALA